MRTLYGQTELLGAYTLHPEGKVDPDTTGVVMADSIEIRIEGPDSQGVGEIVVRHPNMFHGYYKNPEASVADIRDGWMHSGDAGYFNDAKQLVVIDRIKDLAETSHGARFSPQYIENKLKFSPYIAETVVLGAGREALAAMICIRFSIISKWAEKKRIAFTTYTDLASRPEVYDLLRKEVESVNATLPPAQRISRFLLLYKELDADDGELTRTRKVRRSVINEKYADIIDAIYSGKRDIPVDTVIRFQDGTTQRIRTTLRVVDLGGSSATRGGRGVMMFDCEPPFIHRRPGQASVASADPGPITPGRGCLARWRPQLARNDYVSWLWVPAFAGTTPNL